MDWIFIILGFILALIVVKLFDYIVYKVKANRNHRREQKLGKMPDEVKEAKMLLKIGWGGSESWRIISDAAKKYPEWFK